MASLMKRRDFVEAVALCVAWPITTWWSELRAPQSSLPMAPDYLLFQYRTKAKYMLRIATRGDRDETYGLEAEMPLTVGQDERDDIVGILVDCMNQNARKSGAHPELQRMAAPPILHYSLQHADAICFGEDA